MYRFCKLHLCKCVKDSARPVLPFLSDLWSALGTLKDFTEMDFLYFNVLRIFFFQLKNASVPTESMFPCQATCGALPSGARKIGKQERNLPELRSGYCFCVSPALLCGADSPNPQRGGESERRQGNMLSPPQLHLKKGKKNTDVLGVQRRPAGDSRSVIRAYNMYIRHE